MNKAIFLDKDGTLIVDVPYNVNPTQIELYPDAGPALQRMQLAGYQLVVISNQSGIAQGYFTESALPAVWERIADLFAPFGVVFSGFYYCPHDPLGTVSHYVMTCDCRKPKPGMLQRAVQELHLNLSESWMIGDILHDVEAGNRAGCRTMLVNRGNETDWIGGPYRTPTLTVNSLQEAADQLAQTQVKAPTPV